MRTCYRASAGPLSNGIPWVFHQRSRDRHVRNVWASSFTHLQGNGWLVFRKYSTILKYLEINCVNIYLQPIAIYIIGHNPDLTPYTICGTVFQSDLCQIDDVGRELMDWTIEIDETNARPANQSKRINPTNRETLTIVHITDTHTDPLYVVGSLADCDEPVCCREGVLVREWFSEY